MSEQKCHVPILRFTDDHGNPFPDWQRKKLGDVFTWVRTNSLSRESLSDQGGVQNIHYGDIHKKYRANFKQSQEEIPFITASSPEVFQKSDFCCVGDVVIADASENYADIGKAIEIVELNDIPLVAGLHTYIARPVKNTLAVGFSGYLLRTAKMRKQILRIAQGISVLGISKGNLEQLTLELPHPDEQRKIADFLSVVDARVELLRRKQALLEQYKKGVMQRIFSGQIRFTDYHGNPFPDWQEKQLGDVAERITRKNTSNNQNVLTISAQQGLVSQQEFFNKSVSADDITGYYQLHRDEFAYNKSYSKGYPMGAIKRLDRYDIGVVSTLYICFKITSGLPSFFEKFFDSGFMNKEIHKIAQEGARNHGLLNISVVEFFKDIFVPYPHPEEQRKIADFLSAIDNKIDSVAKELNAAQNYKKSLLQQMFV